MAFIRATSVGALAGLAVLGAASCTSSGSSTPTGLYVVDISPENRVLTADASFVITFSADLDLATVNADTVVMAPTERVNTSFLSDIGTPPLSESRRATLLSASVIPTGNRVTVRPDDPLPEGTEISLVVSKALKSRDGEKLTLSNGTLNSFRVDYVTIDPRPTVAGTSLPVGSPALVPPNLRNFTVSFAAPVMGAAAESVRVRGQNGAADAVVGAVELLLDGRTVRVRLEDGSCQPLCPQTDYRVEVGAPLMGLQGQDVVPYQQDFRTLETPDLQGPALVALPQTQSGETQVRFSFQSREPAVGRLRVGAPGGPYTEQFAFYASGPCSGFQAARTCPYSAVVTGLDLGTAGTGNTYGAQLEMTDDFGNTNVFGEFTLRTVLLPKLRISEVYNNPPGAAADEKTSEFIEIYNLSDATPYDLSTMVVATLDRTTGAVVSKMGLVGLGGSPSILQPGKFALAGATVFDPTSVGASQDAVILVDSQPSRTTLLGGLSSSRTSARPIALFDGDPDNGAPLVSVFTAPEDLYSPSSTFPEGVSAERLDIQSDDEENAAWCHSQGGPTPGRANSVASLSSCP